MKKAKNEVESMFGSHPEMKHFKRDLNDFHEIELSRLVQKAKKKKRNNVRKARQED